MNHPQSYELFMIKKRDKKTKLKNGRNLVSPNSLNTLQHYWVKKKWSDISDKPMNLARIKKLHQPQHHYRFNTNKNWRPSESSCGTGVQTIIYVISGGIHYVKSEASQVDDRGYLIIRENIKESVTLLAGEYAAIPHGSRTFKNIGGMDTEFIKVLFLPKEFCDNVDKKSLHSTNQNGLNN